MMMMMMMMIMMMMMMMYCYDISIHNDGPIFFMFCLYNINRVIVFATL